MVLVGGRWLGWSCAFSTAGEPLAVPADLCKSPGDSVAGFKELSSECVYDLQSPASGSFIERETAKLMPDAERMQCKSGRLEQIHELSDSIVQDAHYDGDVWVLQTVLHAIDKDERWRVALMFNSSSGSLVRGMRVWSERRCSSSDPLPLAGQSVHALAAAWESGADGRRCFSDFVQVPLCAHRMELPVAGLQIRASANRVLVAADVGPVVRRRFDQQRGACWVRSRSSRTAHVSAIRASMRPSDGRRTRPLQMALREDAERELATAMRSADPGTGSTSGFEGTPEVLSLKVSELSGAIATAAGAKVELTTLLVARARLKELQAELELAQRVKRVNYQVGAATVIAMRTGKRFELARLLQWVIFAVEGATAAQVDADTVRRACEHVESAGSDNQREIERLCERMRKFKVLAESSTEAGEVENAERMFAKAQAEVQSRASTEDKFTLVGWAPR